MNGKHKNYSIASIVAVFSHLPFSLFAAVLSFLASIIISSPYVKLPFLEGVDIRSLGTDTLNSLIIFVAAVELVNIPLMFCSLCSYLRLARSGFADRLSFREYFTPFSQSGQLWNGMVLLLLFYLMVGACLYFLPIFALPIYYIYCLAPFVLADNPDMSPIKALSESRRMTSGNKLTIFVSTLPFIILNIFSLTLFADYYIPLTLANALLQAMIYVAMASVYIDLKGENREDNQDNQEL